MDDKTAVFEALTLVPLNSDLSVETLKAWSDYKRRVIYPHGTDIHDSSFRQLTLSGNRLRASLLTDNLSISQSDQNSKGQNMQCNWDIIKKT